MRSPAGRRPASSTVGAWTTRWPAGGWFVCGDPSDRGWKDTQIGATFCRLTFPAEMVYREYRLRARTLAVATRRILGSFALWSPIAVTIYRFVPPPSPERIAWIQECNGRFRRERAAGVPDGQRTVGPGRTAEPGGAGLSPDRSRRPLSVGL